MPRSAGLTRSTEDYLKAIYGIAGDGGSPVQTTAIAEALGIAPASVSGMLKRLADGGLLEHVRYRGVRLSEAGRAAALRVMRRHRILESYLTSRLGYDWDSVHDEAERLEHAISDELIDRMALVLGDPPYDPHGAPIPTRDGRIERPVLVTLDELAVGERGELRMVDDKDPERLRYLSTLGLDVGTRFRVTDRQPLDGPITIQPDGKSVLHLGCELARALACVRLESHPPAPAGASR